MKIELADLPLTEFTVSYLVCQFIKSQLEKIRKEKRAAEIAAEYAAAAEKKARLIEEGLADGETDSQLNTAADVDDFWLASDDENDKPKKVNFLKQFQASVSFPYPLKTLENLSIFGHFQGA